MVGGADRGARRQADALGRERRRRRADRLVLNGPQLPTNAEARTKQGARSSTRRPPPPIPCAGCCFRSSVPSVAFLPLPRPSSWSAALSHPAASRRVAFSASGRVSSAVQCSAPSGWTTADSHRRRSLHWLPPCLGIEESMNHSHCSHTMDNQLDCDHDQWTVQMHLHSHR